MTQTLDLSTIGTGSIVAPAGHGKTYTIGDTVNQHPELRILVLTHTHAAIAALRLQLPRRAAKNVRMETIASLSLKVARAFPGRSKWIEGDSIDHTSALQAACRALESLTILRIIADSYDLILVDEYQDCSLDQVTIIERLALRVRTVVVGDPMQGIYDFGKQGAVSWSVASQSFPLRGTLDVAHRWATTNPALGEWLIRARAKLQDGGVPEYGDPVVETTKLRAAPYAGGLNEYLGGESTAKIIPNAALVASIPRIARAYQGRLRVAEAAEFFEIRKVAEILDRELPIDTLMALIHLAGLAHTAMMTGPVKTLHDSLTQRGAASRSKNPVVQAAQHHIDLNSPETAEAFLRALMKHGRSTIRAELIGLTLRTIQAKSSNVGRTFLECFEFVIQQRGHTPSRLGASAVVGSTLRLKGLEFDTVILLDAHNIKSAKHLYVALTRASRRLILATSPN